MGQNSRQLCKCQYTSSPMLPLQTSSEEKKTKQNPELFIKTKDNVKSAEDTGSKKQEAIGETFQLSL